MPAHANPGQEDAAAEAGAGAPAERAAAMARNRRRLLAAAIALLALFIALRALFLTADPPFLLPNGASTRELLVEPPAKSHEARNWALFGAWRTSPADNYQFWRPQSPVWVYGLAAFYRAFGVGYAELRSFAILTAAIGFALLLALAARRLRGIAFCAAGLVLAVDHVAILYDRSGLIEPALNALLIATMLCLAASRRHVLWLVPAQWAFVLAFLTKQTALFAAPVALAFGIAAWMRAARAGPRRGLYRGIVLAHALVLLAGLAAYMARDEYLRTVAWNYGHAMLGEHGHTEIDTSRLEEIDVTGRVLNVIKLSRLFTLLPILGALALVEVLRLGFRAARRRPVDAWSALIALWWLSALAALLLIRPTQVRFCLPLFPPTALLAGSALQTLLRFRPLRRSWGLRSAGRADPRRPSLRRAAAIGLLALCVALNGAFHTHWALRRTYDVVDGNRRLAEAIGDRPAVVIGGWSAPLVLETPYVHYYVKRGFNTDREALAALGVTHLLLLHEDDWALREVEAAFPRALDRLAPAASYSLRNRIVDLYVLPAPLGAPRVHLSPGLRLRLPR